MGKFGGIVICTDLDGTLFRNDKTVSAENKDAIEYFKSNGGFFTFVTGRMPFFIEGAYEAAKPNAPIGCINGGGLFDYENKKYIWHSTMPDCVTELIRCVDENFKDVGIQVNTFYKTYFCKENQTMKRFREITGLENLIGDYGNIKEPIART